MGFMDCIRCCHQPQRNCAGKKRPHRLRDEGRRETATRVVEKAVAADRDKKPGEYAAKLNSVGVGADAGRIRDQRKNFNKRKGPGSQADTPVELPATVTVSDVLYRSEEATGLPLSGFLAPGDAKAFKDTQIYVLNQAEVLGAKEGASVMGVVQGLSATDGPGLQGLKAVYTRAGEVEPFLEEDLRKNPELRMPKVPKK